jgi:hypothetical protein
MASPGKSTRSYLKNKAKGLGREAHGRVKALSLNPSTGKKKNYWEDRSGSKPELAGSSEILEGQCWD